MSNKGQTPGLWAAAESWIGRMAWRVTSLLKRPARQPARCVAPLEHDEARLCGRPATETRVVAELVCPLCPMHAADLDSEPEDEEQTS